MFNVRITIKERIKRFICSDISLALMLVIFVAGLSLTTGARRIIYLGINVLIILIQTYIDVIRRSKEEASSVESSKRITGMYFHATMLKDILRDRASKQTSLVNSQFNFDYPYFSLVRINYVQNKSNPSSDKSIEYYNALLATVLNVIDGMLGFPHTAFITEMEESFYVLLNLESDYDDVFFSDRVVTELSDDCEAAVQALSSLYEIKSSIYLSSVYKGINMIYRTYTDVTDLFEFSRFIDIDVPCMTAYYCEDADVPGNACDPLYLDLDLAMKYRKEIKNNNFREAGNILIEIVSSYLSTYHAVLHLRTAIEDYLRLAYFYLESVDSSFMYKNEPLLLSFQSVYSINTYKELCDRIEQSFSLLDNIYRSGTRQKKVDISEIKLFVQAKYSDYNLSVTMICDEFGISNSYLFRLFHEQESSLLTYIHSIRLNESKRLLRETGMTIDDISQAVGFTGRWTLIRAFRRYEGITPSQYRQSSLLKD